MLENKTAIITGASGGIGTAISKKFAQHGANLVLTCLENKEALTFAKNQAEAQGSLVHNILGDLTNEAHCEAVIDKAKKEFGGIDILVNCAGIISRDDFFDMDQESWQRVIDVNLSGVMNICRHGLVYMEKNNNGKIVNLTSQMAFLPHLAAAPSYEVSKSGLTALTRHLASKFAKNGICVNSIAPGSIDTDLPKSMTIKQREALKNKIPMQRLGHPDEVAQAALFLASNASDYITGSTIHVNGGSLML